MIEIPFFVVCVGHACTLRCKDCGNFTPFTPNENKIYPMDRIIEDLRIIVKHSRIQKLHIQGGEPFLHPNLAEIINFAVSVDNIAIVQIASNGVGKVKCLTALKHPKVQVRISDYRHAESDFRDIFDKEAVAYKVYEFASKSGMWYDMGSINTPREESDEVCTERFNSCPYNKCLTLENSKLGYCSRSIIAEKMQGFTSIDNTGGGGGHDYLRVRDSDDFGQYLENYIKNKRFMEACRYCMGSTGKLIEPAVQI